MIPLGKTEPKKGGIKNIDPAQLVAGRYGTKEMCEILGAEKTFEYSLRAQAAACEALSGFSLDIIPFDQAKEIQEKANLKSINPDRIRELEEQTKHDVIAINKALEEVLSSDEARAHINKARTSADTTETAKALQLKEALTVFADSVENLRDIIIEKAFEFKDTIYMDTTHLYDAVPTVAGRPLIHYAETLQSALDLIKFVGEHWIKGKWGDATGNHHSATTLVVDGIALQEYYCK